MGAQRAAWVEAFNAEAAVLDGEEQAQALLDLEGRKQSSRDLEVPEGDASREHARWQLAQRWMESGAQPATWLNPRLNPQHT